MKASVTLSSMAHVAVLAWGLFSLSGPKPLVVPDVEALPIDIVPISDLTKAVQGEKKAELTDKPAPLPTSKPDVVPEAKNVGEAAKDTKSQRPPEPDTKPADTQRVDAPPPEPAPAPPPEPAPVAKDQPPETKPAPADQQFAALPETAPVPERRPEPPKPRPKADNTRKKKNVEDKIAALLNKETPSAGGAKRSTDPAAFGTSRAGGAVKLSQTEMDALRGAIEQCWSVPAGLADAADMRVTIKMHLTRDGMIDGDPQVEATGGEPATQRTFADSAKRAVLICGQHGYKLPPDKYEAWRDVVVNFDPSQMF